MTNDAHTRPPSPLSSSSTSASTPTLPYCDPGLDRAGRHRADPDWLDRHRAAPTSAALLFRDDRCLTADGRPVTAAPTAESVFLGLDGATALFATDLTALGATGSPVAAEPESTDVRGLFPTLSGAESARLAYARGLLRWHRDQRFCGSCGSSATAAHGGHARACTGCARLLFPRIEPAVIVLVESGERCLLGRHRGSGAWSTLAGFVEVGEDLEGAVRREVAEEAGVAVGEVGYLASQAWPFPAGLMLGFRAGALSEDLDVDGAELDDARWFTRDQVRALGVGERTDSVERFLLTRWLGI